MTASPPRLAASPEPLLWLQPSPDRRLPPMSLRLAWPPLAGLLTILLGWDLVEGVLRFAALAGWAQMPTLPVNPAALSLIAAGLWLAYLAWLYGRRRIWAAVALAVLGAGLLPHTGEAARVVGTATLAVATVWLCLDVAEHHHMPRQMVGIRPRWAAGPGGHLQALAVGMTTALAAGVTAWLAIGLSLLPGPGLTAARDQAAALGLSQGAELVVTAIGSAVREEMLLAAVVLLLGAADRPLWQVYLLAAVIRVLPHGYMGLPALSMAALACVNVWLYWRTRRVVPLMAGHAAWFLIVQAVRGGGL
ncbi:CPBP family glutamic-type intramembrane protease [Thermomonospora cellulosilytica]|uniref:CAAX prenyl protease 2/Lysostaphin resistance protein A-like domain-containing protein n=1 Tax=Thermomonospora cellulosilytica TaxID=1411118 RepID=A0A7W3N1Q5_9ACTN|nr:CPBP family glutamic-type intramembrane protease [Thermomonospora cellulosilytica]MBA9005919.1 hypothetical protein [Thermomonospora cellulosilytica]